MSPTDRCQWCGHLRLEHFTHTMFPDQLECHVKGCPCGCYKKAERPHRRRTKDFRSPPHADQGQMFDIDKE